MVSTVRAYEIFWDGVQLGGSGRPGNTADTEVAGAVVGGRGVERGWAGARPAHQPAARPGGWLGVYLPRCQLRADSLPRRGAAAGAHHLRAGGHPTGAGPAAGRLLIQLPGGPPDLVLSDMAPNTVGHRETDHLRIVGLIELAAAFAIETLKPGGSFVAKAFQGGETAQIIRDLKKHFDKVQHVKPKASRADLPAVFPVAQGVTPWRLRPHDQIRAVRAGGWGQTGHGLVEDLRHAGCASAFFDLGFAARLGDRAPVRIESERTQTRPRIRDDGARTRRRLASRHR